MAKRPAGPKSSREEGLRELATRVGLDRPITCLTEHIGTPDNETAPARHRARMLALVDGVSWPPDWPSELCAQAFWKLVVTAIKELGEGSRTCAAVRVAFGLDVHYRPMTSMEKYLKERLEAGRTAGLFPGRKGVGWPRQLWVEGVVKLGWIVHKRLEPLASDHSGWQAYLIDSDSDSGEGQSDTVQQTGSVPVVSTRFASDAAGLVEGVPPIFVKKMMLTYVMRGRYVARRISELWITSMAHDVDHYMLRAYSHVGGDPVIEFRSLLNCEAGALHSITSANNFQLVACPIWFPKVLTEGEDHFFATETIHLDGDTDDTPLVELLVTSQGIAGGKCIDGVPSTGLTMRLQFDATALPQALWYFADSNVLDQFDKPPNDDPRRVGWTAHGFAQHTFTEPCKPLGHYGLVWQW